MEAHQPTIAVVDDDDIFMVIARKMIGHCAPGWRLMEFLNGEDMLRHIQLNAQIPNHLPDLILLDINMPVMDGWMFLQEYDKLKDGIAKPIRIYLASSSIDVKDIERARANPLLTDYLIKPLTQETIRNITGSPNS